MRVILAEKPSVAQSIAAVLGADQKKNGYLQGENDLVSWCIGHLIELAPPEIYDARYAKWRREDLPIVPSAWESVVSDGTKKQFAVLKDLLNRTDVDEVVCATDAGREGELILEWCMKKRAAPSPSSGSGFLRLRKVPSARVSVAQAGPTLTTRCIVRRCAARGRTGWWASTERGCIPGFTEQSSMSGAS
ncbi:MAG: toprim domain-containing protein [Oscillospiraceae bacterium]